MNEFLSTTEISVDCEYIKGAESFFGCLEPFFKTVTSQILKLETRQYYDETGDASFDLLKKGKMDEAIDLLRNEESYDTSFYKEIRTRNVEFIRCRNVSLPISEYLRWEFEAYKYLVKLGEKIFCVITDDLSDIFTFKALHDFMIFDVKVAFIHDYDETGKIQGGWIVKDQSKVSHLYYLHSFICKNSIGFSEFLSKHNSF